MNPITYEDLKMCSELVQQVNDLQMSLEKTRAKLGLNSLSGSLNKSHSVTNQMYQELERTYTEKVASMLEHIKNVLEAIESSAADQKQKRVLKLRYIDGLSWFDISVRTYLTRQWSITLHNRGLAAMGIERPPKNRRAEA